MKTFSLTLCLCKPLAPGCPNPLSFPHIIYKWLQSGRGSFKLWERAGWALWGWLYTLLQELNSLSLLQCEWGKVTLAAVHRCPYSFLITAERLLFVLGVGCTAIVFFSASLYDWGCFGSGFVVFTHALGQLLRKLLVMKLLIVLKRLIQVWNKPEFFNLMGSFTESVWLGTL